MSEEAAHINNFLRRNQAAARLLRGVDRDARLLDAAQRALPAELRPHCLHATLEGERLCLLTDGPAWASRLRFAVPELLAGLLTQGTAARDVRVRVAPVGVLGTGVRARGEGPAACLSQATVAHLKVAAAAIGDTDLAAALLRLAGAGSATPQEAARQETARGRGA